MFSTKRVPLVINARKGISIIASVLWQQHKIYVFSIYTVNDLGVLSNLIGSLSLANEHYSPPTE